MERASLWWLVLGSLMYMFLTITSYPGLLESMWTPMAALTLRWAHRQRPGLWAGQRSCSGGRRPPVSDPQGLAPCMRGQPCWSSLGVFSASVCWGGGLAGFSTHPFQGRNPAHRCHAGCQSHFSNVNCTFDKPLPPGSALPDPR